MFDASTLERVASIRLESDFHSLISVKGWPWIIGSTQACPISDNSYDIDRAKCLDIPTIKDTQDVTQAISSQNKAFILIRIKPYQRRMGLKPLGTSWQ